MNIFLKCLTVLGMLFIILKAPMFGVDIDNAWKIAIFGFIFGYLWLLGDKIELVATIKAHKRRLEKKEVDSDSNSSKIEVLEAKIKTLEKALDNVLKDENK